MYDQQWIDNKRRNRMHIVDSMDPELRKLVNAYGFGVVNAFLEIGIKKPKHIRHLVEIVLDEFSPTRGSYSKQGIRTEVE